MEVSVLASVSIDFFSEGLDFPDLAYGCNLVLECVVAYVRVIISPLGHDRNAPVTCSLVHSKEGYPNSAVFLGLKVLEENNSHCVPRIMIF